MELMQTVVAPYITGAVWRGGALLFVPGLVVRLLAATGQLKGRVSTVMRYGVLVMLLALALWAILWFMEAWQSGLIEGWLESLQ